MARFVKGQVPWNKGQAWSDEVKAKLSISKKALDIFQKLKQK